MAKYRRIPVIIEAITFDELVEHGKSLGVPLVNGMPWSFDYCGHPISHENDDCYLIPTMDGTMRLNRGDMLLSEPGAGIYPCGADVFNATHESV